MNPGDDLQPRDGTERSGRTRVVGLVAAFALGAALGVSIMPTVGGAGPSRPAIAAAAVEPSAPGGAVAENETTMIEASAASLPQCVELEVPYELAMGADPSPPCR